MNRRWTRRAMIAGGTVVGGLAAAGGLSALACSGNRTLAALDPDRLRAGLADIVAPARIGAAYGSGRSRETLLAELAAKPGLCAAAGHECPATLRAAFRAQVAEDFRSGDVVVADRFVVARSEGIVAALGVGAAT